MLWKLSHVESKHSELKTYQWGNVTIVKCSSREKQGKIAIAIQFIEKENMRVQKSFAVENNVCRYVGKYTYTTI